MIRTITKTETRRVTARAVCIDDAIDAQSIIQDYFKTASCDFREKWGGVNTTEANVLVYAAAQYLVDYLGATLSVEACAELGVTMPAACPTDPLEPTWTSQDGVTRRVPDLASQHIRNILALNRSRRSAIYNLLRDELNRRGEDE